MRAHMRSNCAGQRDQESLVHIVARFMVCKKKDLVWEDRDETMDSLRFKDSFFVLDLAKELAKERFILRQAVRIVRERDKSEEEETN